MLTATQSLCRGIYNQRRLFTNCVRFSRGFLFNSGLALESVVPAARPNSIHWQRIMAQKSITSFFMKKDVSSSNNETPTKPQNKEGTKASAVPYSSPLKEPNRHEEDSNSIDSPIKVSKKSKKKRLDSSSEEENGSPKSITKESPQKSEPKKGAKRKSSPTATSNEKKAKKTKNVDEEVKPSPKIKVQAKSKTKKTKKEVSSEAVSGDESMDEEEEGDGISDSELNFLKLEKGDSPEKKSRRRSAAKNEDDDDNTKEVEPSSEEKNKEEPKSKAKDKKRSAQEKAALPKKARKSNSKEEDTKKKPSSPKKSENSPDTSPPKKSNDKSPPKVKKEKSSPEKESKKETTKQSPKSEEKASSSGSAKKVNPFAAMMGKSPKVEGGESNSKGIEYEEIVKKSKYDPIDDAIWKQGQKTPYLAFSKTLQAIEATSGRLKTIEILSNYFRSVMVLSPDDLLPSVYMCLNKLAPAYEGMELGIGETVLMKAIAQTTGRSTAQIKADASKLGDLGIVAETSRGGQRVMFQPAPLTIVKVFKELKSIANLKGNKSQDEKVKKIQGMLVACKQSEARYLIRSLAGKLRIGLAEQSVLQALAQACVMTPPAQEYPPEIRMAYKDQTADKFKEVLDKEALKLKTAYCECPCYDKVIPVLLKEGIDGVAEKIKMEPGIPLKPMLAHPTKGVQEVLDKMDKSGAKFTCEWKYDGERAQIHLLEDSSIRIYSRNQEDNTSKYPDIIQRFSNCKLDGVTSCVIDSEAVAWDREKKQIQPFQVLSTRKRKDAAESEIKVQVAVFAFDLLYLNGEALVRKPFEERRELLRKHFKEVEGEFVFAKFADPDSVEAIQEVLEQSVAENCEGLMVKTLDVDATYEIAKRSHNWLKLKKDYLDGVGDTLDVVVMGGYLGKGKRTGSYGGFLLACYDEKNEEYQSLCKIGTGFTDEDLAKHWTFFQDHKVDKPKSYYAFDSNLAPDHWFEPVQVWEIKAADLSISPVHRAAVGIVDPDKGISLRFPRFLRIRDDKGPEDATSADQVAKMYNSQEQIKNQNNAKKSSNEDDFDL